jgi:hypothetical protein
VYSSNFIIVKVGGHRVADVVVNNLPEPSIEEAEYLVRYADTKERWEIQDE